MAGRKAADHQRTEAQARAWELRQRGWTQVKIARELAVDQGTVSRWLDQLERRELARLTERVKRAKTFQNGVLEHLLSESLDAWEQSKSPRRRITQQKGEPILGADGKPLLGPDKQPLHDKEREVVEVIGREGNPAYLDRAFVALAQIRKLWGLDVAPKQNDEDGPQSFAAIVERLKANAQRHDEARQEPPASPDAPAES